VRRAIGGSIRVLVLFAYLRSVVVRQSARRQGWLRLVIVGWLLRIRIYERGLWLLGALVVRRGGEESSR